MDDDRVRMLVFAFALVAAVSSVVAIYTRGKKEAWKPRGKFQVILINMDAAKDRLEHFKAEYASTDLGASTSFIREPAIDGRSLPLHVLVSERALAEIKASEAAGYRLRHYELTRGAVGCFLSHMNVFAKLLHTDADFFVVFEDDVTFRGKKDILKTLPNPPTDADIVLLGHMCLKCSTGTPWRITRRFFGTHAYIITRRGAKKVLAVHASIGKIECQIDWFMSDMAERGDLKVYAATQHRAWQTPAFASSIQVPIRPVAGIDSNTRPT